MKRFWTCEWEIARENKVHKQDFPSFDEAVKAMRKIITECIDLEEYIADLEPAAADYLRNYLSDPGFPRSEEEVPTDWDLPERGDLALYPRWIRWVYPYDAYPVLHTNIVLDPEEEEDLFFDFYYNYPEEATGHGAEGLNIKMIPRIDYGTSAYPLMVWNALTEEPQTCEQLIDSIWQQYNTVIERKAVGRHLKLLENLGFSLLHNSEGYYRSGAFREPKADVKYRPSAYPLMILQVLDGTAKTQAEIIRAVQGKYGIKIDRRAVKRNLELLQAFFFRIQKNKDGYSVQK